VFDLTRELYHNTKIVLLLIRTQAKNRLTGSVGKAKRPANHHR
jgi:hypothetical protein